MPRLSMPHDQRDRLLRFDEEDAEDNAAPVNASEQTTRLSTDYSTYEMRKSGPTPQDPICRRLDIPSNPRAPSVSIQSMFRMCTCANRATPRSIFQVDALVSSISTESKSTSRDVSLLLKVPFVPTKDVVPLQNAPVVRHLIRSFTMANPTTMPHLLTVTTCLGPFSSNPTPAVLTRRQRQCHRVSHHT